MRHPSHFYSFRPVRDPLRTTYLSQTKLEYDLKKNCTRMMSVCEEPRRPGARANKIHRMFFDWDGPVVNSGVRCDLCHLALFGYSSEGEEHARKATEKFEELRNAEEERKKNTILGRLRNRKP